MPDDELQPAVAFTLIKKCTDDWFVEQPDQDKFGPYRTAGIALQVMAIRAQSAREQGLKTSIHVQDNYGTAHSCGLFDRGNSTDGCVLCENSWATIAGPLPPRCPLWETLRDQ